MNLTDEDRWRLQHIIEAIANIEQCVTEKQNRNKFLDAALERFIINIGEMCRGVSKKLQIQYSDIPWANIISMRNILVHEYYKLTLRRCVLLQRIKPVVRFTPLPSPPPQGGREYAELATVEPTEKKFPPPLRGRVREGGVRAGNNSA